MLLIKVSHCSNLLDIRRAIQAIRVPTAQTKAISFDVDRRVAFNTIDIVFIFDTYICKRSAPRCSILSPMVLMLVTQFEPT